MRFFTQKRPFLTRIKGFFDPNSQPAKFHDPLTPICPVLSLIK
jgi:hypothetical protein